MKAGDRIYKVHRWPTYNGGEKLAVESAELSQASERQITLKNYVSFAAGKKYHTNVIGRVFFATPAEAIADHRARSLEAVAQAKRTIAQAEADIVWCDEQLAKEAT